MANSAPPKRLIVTADDFGLTRGVNAAVVRAYRHGIVTTASLIPNGLAFDFAAGLAKENPGLDVGLHLNLTEGRAVSNPADVPSLATLNGFRHNHPIRLAVAIAKGHVRPVDLEREIRSQCEKVINSGVTISHVDGHKHVHVIPHVLHLLGKVLPDYGVRAIRPVVERAPGLRHLVLNNFRAGARIFEQYLFARVAGALWKKPAFLTPDCLYGVTQTGFLDFDTFTNIINHLKSGVGELMCHPGYVDAELDRIPTRLRSQRERELELLTSPEARNVITRSGIDLTSYREMAGAYGSSATNKVFHRYSGL